MINWKNKFRLSFFGEKERSQLVMFGVFGKPIPGFQIAVHRIYVFISTHILAKRLNIVKHHVFAVRGHCQA